MNQSEILHKINVKSQNVIEITDKIFFDALINDKARYSK